MNSSELLSRLECQKFQQKSFTIQTQYKIVSRYLRTKAKNKILDLGSSPLNDFIQAQKRQSKFGCSLACQNSFTYVQHIE